MVFISNPIPDRAILLLSINCWFYPIEESCSYFHRSSYHSYLNVDNSSQTRAEACVLGESKSILTFTPNHKNFCIKNEFSLL